MSSAAWPASAEALSAGRAFLRNIAQQDQQQQRVVLVPDKDADGLCAGAIIKRTLERLGCTGGRDLDCAH